MESVVVSNGFIPAASGLLHLAQVAAAVLVASGAVACSVVDAVGVGGRAVRALLGSLFWQPLALHVSLDPEVGEEHEEEGSVHPDEVDEDGELVVAALHEVILGSVEGHQDKLDLLGRNQPLRWICLKALGAEALN